jgi:hypothetical protein
MNKLKTGKGSLIRRVETIRELGARASKALPDSATGESPELLMVEEDEEGQVQQAT